MNKERRTDRVVDAANDCNAGGEFRRLTAGPAGYFLTVMRPLSSGSTGLWSPI